MSKLKTQENDADVFAFIQSVEDADSRQMCITILQLMNKVSGSTPRMWGNNMIGFGRYYYQYANGSEGNWFITGFSPRKKNFTIYIMPGFSNFEPLMKKLGKHKTGKSCLYIRKLSDINLEILESIITESVQYMRKNYKCN